MGYNIRTWLGQVVEVCHEGGPVGQEPTVKVLTAAVLANPYAGRYSDDLDELLGPSAELGEQLTKRAVALLGGRAVEGYGKGAIAGVAGEQEHAVACVTTPFGNALRDGVGGGAAWISSTTKVGSAGVSLDIPLAYKDALYVRSHYDTVTLCVPDAPRPDEIIVAAVLSSGGRVHHRLGGLTKSGAVGDGVR
ncbi:MAG: amino acid synthesis family protein [Sciscionella sp.]